MGYGQVPYDWYEYGLVILLNARTFVSLVGALMIVHGSWKWDREWDDQKYVESYTDMTTGETKLRQQRESVGPNKESSMEIDYIDWGIVKSQRIVIVGWILFGFSYVLESHTWFSLVTFEEGKDYLTIPTIAVLAMIAFLQTALIPTSMATRQMTTNQQFYGSLLIGGYSVLGVLSLMLQEEHNPTRALAPLGAICISLSPIVMWRSRIMGEAFDEQGIANNKPVLFNFGGPLLSFGMFCFWLAHNTIHEHPNLDYIPLYPSIETFLCFLASAMVVIVYWLVGYALDEMPAVGSTEAALESVETGKATAISSDRGKGDTVEALRKAKAFGLEDFFFGYVFELKIVYAVAWALFGVAYILRTHDKSVWLSVFFLFVAIGMGLASGFVQEKGLRKKDVEQVAHWMRVSDLLLLVLFLIICSEKRLSAIVVTAIGIVLMGSGLYHLHVDRKRGRHWLENDEIRMPPVVYSFGAIAYPLGMMLLAWGVSIHPKT